MFEHEMNCPNMVHYITSGARRKHNPFTAELASMAEAMRRLTLHHRVGGLRCSRATRVHCTQSANPKVSLAKRFCVSSIDFRGRCSIIVTRTDDVGASRLRTLATTECEESSAASDREGLGFSRTDGTGEFNNALKDLTIGTAEGLVA